ncbi:MAG: Mur ligase family protein [Candidatus Portnoybacteria bacterium]
MKLQELKNKKILILGFGREGKDTFLFLRKLFPKKVIGIADQNPKPDLGRLKLSSGRKHFGKDYLKSLKNYEVIIKSPGIPFKTLPKPTLKKLISQTELFFDNCKDRVVGITGTKGKSTTSAMIYEVLRAGGIKAHLVGNIGKPALSFLNKIVEKSPQRVYVYELSSHQLYSLKKSPQVAVFLNVYPEHLDYYRNFKEYARAKANITLWQKKEDYLIYNSEDKLVSRFARKSKAKKIPIKGKYYELDKEGARAVGEIFKIPRAIISRALKNFKYLPHRLEPVGIYRGITFYNDALATIPEATIEAMEALGGEVETIMLGGFERNISFKKLVKKVLKNKIKTLILFPTTGRRIWRDIVKASKRRGVPEHFFTDNMKDAVRLAYLHTKKGKICLLSTASPSFSIFKDYEEKGNLFKKYVKQLSHEKTR